MHPVVSVNFFVVFKVFVRVLICVLIVFIVFYLYGMIVDGYWLSILWRRIVICCSLVTFDVLVLSSDLMSFQIERCRIEMARVEDNEYRRPYLTIMRSAFSMPEVNSISSSLIWEKSTDVMELKFIFACISLAFSRIDLLLRVVFKCCLYFTTLFVFVN